MKEVLPSLQNLGAIAFFLLGVATVVVWLRHRDRSLLFLGLAIVLLSLVSLLGRIAAVMNFSPQLLTELSLVAFMASGYALLLYRDSMIPLRRAWHVIALATIAATTVAYETAQALRSEPGRIHGVWLCPVALQGFDDPSETRVARHSVGDDCCDHGCLRDRPSALSAEELGYLGGRGARLGMVGHCCRTDREILARGARTAGRASVAFANVEPGLCRPGRHSSVRGGRRDRIRQSAGPGTHPGGGPGHHPAPLCELLASRLAATRVASLRRGGSACLHAGSANR